MIRWWKTRWIKELIYSLQKIFSNKDMEGSRLKIKDHHNIEINNFKILYSKKSFFQLT